MNDSSSMMLIGIGGGGSAIARGVRRAFGEGLRFLAIDTDAATAAEVAVEFCKAAATET